jgi:hypothetical protein
MIQSRVIWYPEKILDLKEGSGISTKDLNVVLARVRAMSTQSSSKSTETAKLTVYDYIRWLAHNVPPERAMVAFYRLLCDRIAVGYPEVIVCLNQIIVAEEFDRESGLHFLNRSFYTICNPWHLDIEKVPYLDRLIEKLDHLPPSSAQDPLTRSLRRRLHEFNQSEYGSCLRRQIRLSSRYGKYDYRHPNGQGLLGDYLPDYFYLYCSTTRTPDIEELEKATYDTPFKSGLGYKQSQKLEEMYRSLGKYRRLREQGVNDLVNPTKLPVTIFEQGLVDYHPKRPHGFTARALALEKHIIPTTQYQVCRPQIQEYLMGAIEPLPKNIQGNLFRDLFRALATLEEQVLMAGSTVISLFTRLLDAVFLPGFNTSNILRFRRYLDNAGPVSITGILLSLVLACPMIRFDLEKKLGYLYRCFEEASLQSVQWVVDFFEHINLALVMNAKRIGYFSVITQLPNMDSI